MPAAFDSDLAARLSDALNDLTDPQKREALRPALEPDAALLVLEQAVEKLLGTSGRLDLQAELQRRADRVAAPSDKTPRRCPDCGVDAPFHRRALRRLQSTIGELRIARSAYHCRCGTYHPADAVVGIEPNSRQTPFLEQLTMEHGRDCGSYRSAQELMARTLEAPKATRTFGDVVARAAATVHERQATDIAQARRAPHTIARRAHAATADDTLILEVDGGMVPCRPTHAMPKGRAAEGRPQTKHREAKLGSAYRLGDRVVTKASSPDRPPRARILHSVTTARIEHWDDFGAAFYAQAVGVGLLEAARTVVLGDGAKWIDQFQQAYAPDAIRILDFYHAMEHVAAPAKLVLDDPKARRRWISTQRKRLRAGDLDAVLRALRKLKDTWSTSGKVTRAELNRAITKEVQYLTRRRDHMHYPEYERLGLPIGSGLIEGRVKNLAKARTDRGGMRWTKSGAQDILTLRAAKASNEPASPDPPTARQAA